EGLGLGVVADQLQALDLEPQEIQPRVLLEEEASRQPTERRLTLDSDLIRTDQMPLHGPPSDEAVKSPKTAIRRRELRLRLVCHASPPPCAKDLGSAARAPSSVGRSGRAVLDSSQLGRRDVF